MAMNAVSDTSPEAEAIQLGLFAAMLPTERLSTALNLSAYVIGNAKRAIARVRPELTPREAAHFFIELHYGKKLADEVRKYEGERNR